MKQVVLKSKEETNKFAAGLWREVRPFVGTKAVLFALEGPLGAGKTAFTKALGKSAGIKEVIDSPSFVLHSIYGLPLKPFKTTFNHIDAWRVEGWEELNALGLAKMIFEKQIIVIEWAGKFEKDIKKLRDGKIKIVWVKFNYGERESERRIEWEITQNPKSK